MFGHDFRDSGTAVVAVDNPGLGVRLEVAFDSSTLPALHQWKMSGEGHYALGLEPVNVNTFGGRAGAAAAGILPILRRSREVSYSVELRLGPSHLGGTR